jgi:hypothetical protein
MSQPVGFIIDQLLLMLKAAPPGDVAWWVQHIAQLLPYSLHDRDTTAANCQLEAQVSKLAASGSVMWHTA